MESVRSLEETHLGDGALPSQLDRFNWSAYIWSGFWALAYGIWPWFWGLGALRFAGMFFFVRFNRSPSAHIPALAIAVTAAWIVTNWSFDAVLALNANRLVWERRRRAGGKARPISLAAYVSTQKRWALIGLAALAVSYGLGILRDGIVSPADAAGTALVPVVLAGGWLLDR